MGRGLRILQASGVILVGTLLLRTSLYAAPEVDTEPITGPVIDLHVHAASRGRGSTGFTHSDIQDYYKMDFYARGYGLGREATDAATDPDIIRALANGIQASDQVDQAVVLALDGVVDADGNLDPDRTLLYVPNDLVAQNTALHPELHFGASINPYRSDALERLEQVHDNGAVLVKWIPSFQYIDPSDSTLTPFYERMRQLELVLLTHTGNERSFPGAKDDLSDPRRLTLPLDLGLTVIAAHAASTGEADGKEYFLHLVDMFADYPNLYTDISSLTQINKLGYLRRLLDFPDARSRLIYGSDMPLPNTPLVSPWYFPLSLKVGQMARISRIQNPWDQDVSLKRALGVPSAVFHRAASLLRIPSAESGPDQ
ncbi:MAG: amidohydrolase family protein [Myxococcota bacterium]|jgi:predicted TIM-barrel fold metal-dependent hydrolase|nr:amidohydrolase family protein [Myxococcota bacterium]